LTFDAGHRSISAYAAAAGLYACAIVLCFPTLVAHPGSRISYGFTDGASSIRDLWAAAAQHRDPFNFTHDAFSGAPQGSTRSPAVQLAQSAIQSGFVWELRGVLGLVGAWNAFLFLGLFATALAMFVFLDRLGCTLPASLLGGYVFAFGPYALERAYAGHLALLQNWIYPVLAASLLRLRERRSVLWATGSGATIAVAFYLSAYQGLLAAVMALVFFAVEIARPGARPVALRMAALAAMSYATSLLAMTPIFVLYANERSAVVQATAHKASDPYTYAASFLAYFLPSPRNPLFHWLRGVHPSDLTEETLFVGYLTVALALTALVLLVRGDPWLNAASGRRRNLLFFAVLAPAAFLLSLPPSYQLGSVRIPMPSAAIGLFSSIWRAYSRFGLLAGFAVIVLAAFALSALSWRPGRRWRFLTPLAVVIVFCEILPGNLPTLATSANAQPTWVRWLAEQPRGIVATYPWNAGDALGQDEWYEIFDRDPQFELPLPEVPTPRRNMAIRLLTEQVGAPLTPQVLAAEGVRYVVVHDDAYRANGLAPPRLDPRSYRLLERFGAVRIFAVSAPRANVARALRANASQLAPLQGLGPPGIVYASGFNGPEQFDGETSRWMIQRGELVLVNTAPAMELTIKAVAFANQKPRLLELLDAAGHVLGRQLVPTHAVTIRFGPFSLPHGSSTLTLIATPGAEQLGPSDPREASVFLEPIGSTPLAVYPAGG
jgi:hypothetical protein